MVRTGSSTVQVCIIFGGNLDARYFLSSNFIVGC